jgi:hypothetical protein
MAEALYQKTGGAAGASPNGAGATDGGTDGASQPQGEEVIDAEFKETK